MPLLSGALGALKDSAVSVMSLIVTMAASDFQGPDFQDSSKFFSSRISPLPPSGLPELAPALRWIWGRRYIWNNINEKLVGLHHGTSTLGFSSFDLDLISCEFTFDICATVFCDISDRLNCGVEAPPLSGSKY